eukprot:3239683-Amphidinium_carterae.1
MLSWLDPLGYKWCTMRQDMKAILSCTAGEEPLILQLCACTLCGGDMLLIFSVSYYSKFYWMHPEGYPAKSRCHHDAAAPELWTINLAGVPSCLASYKKSVRSLSIDKLLPTLYSCDKYDYNCNSKK